jgi:hypothetical protein
VAIRKNQGYLSLQEIIHFDRIDRSGDREFECEEKVVLFYNIPSKGSLFLLIKPNAVNCRVQSMRP